MICSESPGGKTAVSNMATIKPTIKKEKKFTLKIEGPTDGTHIPPAHVDRNRRRKKKIIPNRKPCFLKPMAKAPVKMIEMTSTNNRSVKNMIILLPVWKFIFFSSLILKLINKWQKIHG
jgi:hypothetical protein